MSRRRLTMWVSIAGVVAVALYAGLGALQLLVLGPLAAVPGRTIEEIRWEVTAAGGSMDEAAVLIVLGAGVVIAVVTAVIAVRARLHPAITAMSFLIVLMLGAPVLFQVSFLPGISVADTFAASGGVMSAGLLPFFAVSAVSGILILAGVVVATVRGRVAARAVAASVPSSVTN